MKNHHRILGLTALMFAWLSAHPAAAEPPLRHSISLDGEWQFRMDPQREGDAGKWFEPGVDFPDRIKVPGNWQAQGFGEPVRLVRNNYQGLAWYRRTIEVPKGWKGQRIGLRFQSVINFGVAYVNGREVGRIDSFVAYYEFDVTDAVRFGAENVFAVQVDSGSTEKIARENMNLGDPNSTNGYVGMIQYWAKWGGIIGHVELTARPSPSVEDVVIRADTAKKVASVLFSLKRTEAGQAWEGSAKVEIVPVTGTEPAWSVETPLRFAPEATQSEPVRVAVDMPAMHLWSPEDPFLYQVRVTLLQDSKEVDSVVERTGMREFAVTNNGGAFLINGRPHFLRGVGYDSIEPITGTPMPDKKIYIERLQHLKDLGFNCVRMLAHTPVKEFFDAADEVGMLVQSDGEWFLGFAAIMSLETSRLLTDQVPRLIKEHRNRPSWYAFSCMNEGAFINAEDATAKRAYIDGAYRAFQELDPTRFFLASDGGADLWPTDIISSLGDMKKASEAGASTPPAQVLLGDLDHFSYFSRGLSDEEMQGLAGVASGVPEAEAAIRRLNPAGYWAGKDVAGGKDLADEAPKLLAAGSQPFSAGIWVKPKGFRPGDFGTFFSFGAAEESKAILVCLDGYTAQGQVVVGRFNRNVLASKTSLVVNEWNHVGVSFDGVKLRLFVNGKPDGEVAEKVEIAPKDLKLGSLINRPVRSAEDYRNRPHIWHEFNQTYVGPLPDVYVEKKLIGGVMSQEANLMERHRARLASFGLLDRYASLRQTSIESYQDYVKQAFEAARQMPNLDGYHWWVVSEIPAGFECDITGTGVLDMVYQPEKFPDPKIFLPFNSASVLLIDADIDQRVLASDEPKTIGISLSHYGAVPVKDGHLAWQLKDAGRVLQQGAAEGVTAELGEVAKIGSIELGPLNISAAKQLTLEVQLQSDGATQSNAWKFWVFPKQKQSFEGHAIVNLTSVKELDSRYATGGKNNLYGAKLCLAEKMTPELLDYVEQGGSLILLERDEAASARSRQVTASHVDKPPENASRILKESWACHFGPAGSDPMVISSTATPRCRSSLMTIVQTTRWPGSLALV